MRPKKNFGPERSEMGFKVVIEPRAIADIQDGIDYYEEQLEGLGERFSATVDHYIHAISQNPYYHIRYEDYRAIPTDKFPYLIVYYLNEAMETAYVLAVFHTSQDPKKLPK
jgi:toxin ParE1/3/4